MNIGIARMHEETNDIQDRDIHADKRDRRISRMKIHLS